jgi:hypothetical protein
MRLRTKYCNVTCLLCLCGLAESLKIPNGSRNANHRKTTP